MRLPRFLFLLPALLLAASALFAQSAAPERIDTVADAASLVERANKLYEDGDFKGALGIYERVARSGYSTAAVLGNAGAAAYRDGDPGRAVLYYRRALRVDPGYDRALQSLRVVSPASNDAGSSFWQGAVEGLFRLAPPGLWLGLSQLLLLFFSFAVYRALASEDPDARSHWFAVGAYAALVLAAVAACGYGSYRFRTGGGDAVILAPDTVLRSAPAAASSELFALPAGTVVRLLEEPVSGFVRCRLADGSTGYAPTAGLEPI
ncbi:MAG: hypothetical protein SF028_01960 [Candidatus Sumerlaeia bacterium]|nr:hypothetical protein [Candidatus Sumerlaeia bacterium]